jgi:hypothetical protein
VLPFYDRRIERFDSELAGRRVLVKGNRQLLLAAGRLTEGTLININNDSHSSPPDVVVPDGGDRGVLVAQGGAIGGWALYLHEGGRSTATGIALLAVPGVAMNALIGSSPSAAEVARPPIRSLVGLP